MFVRAVLALVSSTWYGLLIMLAVVPVALLFLASMFAVASGLPNDPPAQGAETTSALILVLLGIMGVVMNITMVVQLGRYAGSFCKYRPIRAQPAFTTAFWRGALIMTALLIVTTLASLIAILVLQAFSTEIGISGAQIIEFMALLETLDDPSQGQPGASPSALQESGVIEALRFAGMAYTMLLAMLLVPAVCGAEGERGHVWRLRFLIYRVFVALPYLALMVFLVTEAVLSVEQALIGEPTAPGLSLVIRLNLQLVFFWGLAFAHEALLLRYTREFRREAREILQALSRRTDPDARSLRGQRSGIQAP